MVDQKKVIMMSKIAVYEKRYLQKDRRITDYFIEDYVGMNNTFTRLGISLITLFFIGVGAFEILYKGIIFPTSLTHFMEVYINDYIGPWILLIVIYTIVSSVVYTMRYKRVSKRMNQYKKLIKDLKKYEASEEGANDEI